MHDLQKFYSPFAHLTTCASFHASMTGWIVAVIFLLLGMGAGFYLLSSWRREQSENARLKRESLERLERKRRFFEFLHTLGNATFQERALTTLYRIIAEGAANVVNADGGTLYLAEGPQNKLVPRHHTKDCPPLIALPERIVDQARTNTGTLGSFLRLHSVAPNEGIIGEVFTTQQPQIVSDLRKHANFNGSVNPFQKHVSALVVPLSYKGRQLGVLAAANNKANHVFSQDAFDVFIAVTEQAAFALGNAQAHQEANAKRQLDAELRNASEIQRILLPEKSPEMPGFEIAGRNVPAKLVSGDYFDFIPIGSTHLGVAIADVCGKGIPAALITAMCRSVLRSNARENLVPSSVLAAVNRNLFPDIREDMFITVAYAVLATDGSSLNYARAGHTNPLVWRKRTGEVEEIVSGGLAVGVDKGDVFERVTRDVSIPMESGDVMLLYTDGVDESTDHKGLLFGLDRIKAALAVSAPHGASNVVETLCQQVNDFMGGDPQGDDITLVVIRKK